MHDIEKIIKGLKCIKGDLVLCKYCPYSDEKGYGRYNCKSDCASDAITLLKELMNILPVEMEQKNDSN